MSEERPGSHCGEVARQGKGRGRGESGLSDDLAVPSTQGGAAAGLCRGAT